MRRVLILLAAAVLLSAPSWAGGGIGFFGTWADTESAEDSFGGGGILEFDLGAHWEIQMRGSRYTDFQTEFRLFDDEDLTRQDLEVTALDFGVVYDFNPMGTAVPYVGGGFTYMMFDLDPARSGETPPRSGEIEDEGGWYGLLGIEFALSESWGLFVEGMYRNVKANLEGDDLGFQPVDREVDMSGVAVNAGLLFTW